MSLPLPAWLDKVPEHRREAERKRFLMRIAALYASREGTQASLSAKLGLHAKTLVTFTVPSSTKKISPAMAHNIAVLTDGVIRAYDLNDDMM